MATAENICRAIGDGELWASAVALNEALNEYSEYLSKARRTAFDEGMEQEEWWALQRR